jgi:DNA-binding transcriptional LysR family regulator
MMFFDHHIEYPQNVTECASVVLFTELAMNTDAVSYWSQRLLERVQALGQELEVLDIAEKVPPMNISLVCRDQELMTREAKALADELVYAYKSPHAPKLGE